MSDEQRRESPSITIDLLEWFRKQARAHHQMVSGARQLGILTSNRECEELELLMAEAYRRGFDDASEQTSTESQEKKT